MKCNLLPKDQISYIRQPDPETPEEFMRFPALLISENRAYAISDDHLELCVVSPSHLPNEYTIVSISEPCFYVGSDEQAVFYDLKTMTLVDFSRKYANLSIYEKSRRLLIDARWKKGLSVENVANHLGMSYHNYLCVEQGTQSVSVEKALRIASLLGRKIEELF